MKRWNPVNQAYVERPDIDKFTDEILEVCERHGFGFSTGDESYCLDIVNYNRELTKKELDSACDCTNLGPAQ